MSRLSPHCVVTDHALLRWLDRVCGFPIETYRTELAKHLAVVACTGVTQLRSAEATYCFRNGVLVTVLSPEMSGIASRRKERVSEDPRDTAMNPASTFDEAQERSQST